MHIQLWRFLILHCIAHKVLLMLLKLYLQHILTLRLMLLRVKARFEPIWRQRYAFR